MLGTNNERRVETLVGLAERELGHISPEQLDRGWQRLEQPLSRRAPAYPRVPEKAPRVRAWLAGFATASAAALLAGAGHHALRARTEPALRYTIEGPAEARGGAISSPSVGAARVRFSDESRIDLGASTKLAVEALDAHGAQIALVDGAVDVYVKPRAGASWGFVAGPFRVNVKGTAFHLAFAAEPGRLTLQMRSGLVEVLAPPNRIIAVGKDESLELFSGPAPPKAPQASPPSAPAAPAASHPEVPPSSGDRTSARGSHAAGTSEPGHRRPALVAGEPSPPAAVTWSALLAHGDFAAVVADAERRGIGDTIARASAVDLSSLADAARYTKHYDLARQVLLAMRARFAGADPARDSSFFLGRLAEAVPERTETALAWYDTYLREAPHGIYASEALGREMALLARGAPGRARKVATQYLEGFPHGPQAELARSLLEAE